ncbi:MAG: hypothetical protein JWP34_4986, partial [Massilia sp.]|nr:hypothetical protein [Massilia sp.]
HGLQNISFAFWNEQEYAPQFCCIHSISLKDGRLTSL